MKNKTNKFLNLFLLYLVTITSFVFLTMTNIFAEDVTITWDANREADLSGYELHYGNDSRKYTESDVVSGNITTHKVKNLNPGQYFFALKAFDSFGNVSGFSNEVSYMVRKSVGSSEPDIIPPTIKSVKMNDDPTRVIIALSEPVDISSATYSIFSGISVFSDMTIISNDFKTVTLTTHPHSENIQYILNVVDLKDLAGNVIDQSNSTVYSFVSPTLASDGVNDDFSVNTTGNYAVTDVWTAGGVGSFKYDAWGERAQIVTGDNVGLKISQSLEARERGVFSIDFSPTVKYPAGGIFLLRLVQDKNNYYELLNTDGYGPKKLKKYVNGVRVASVPFVNEFSQNNNYTVVINFSPEQTTVAAFGETISINTDNKAIIVGRFELELRQQDSYIDNIIYKD